MDNSGNLPIQIIVILVLILINGFFSASEMAIVSSNRTRIGNLADDGVKSAKILLKLLSEPSNFLSTIQVGITFAGFFTAGSAATNLVDNLSPILTNLKIPFADTVSFVLITFIISYFTLVFGELIPKRIALQNPDKLALFAAKPINMMSIIFKPFVKFLSGSVKFFGRMVGINSESMEEQISIEEIRSLIEVGKEKGVINQTERDMLDGIFEFDNKLAREVMTPRTDVEMIDIDDNTDIIFKMMTNSRYSRFPVYSEDMDNIIGILVLKDVYREKINRGEITDLKKIMRKALFVPETKHIDDLFKEMQQSRSHIALLIDEYGGFSGIVTIEDLLEEIVGNIFDEHDLAYQDIVKTGDREYLINGKVSIDQINDDLYIKLNDENADTIGGYFIEKLGRVPEPGDKVYLDEGEMEVLRVEGKRIKDIKFIKYEEKTEDEENDEE